MVRFLPDFDIHLISKINVSGCPPGSEHLIMLSVSLDLFIDTTYAVLIS